VLYLYWFLCLLQNDIVTCVRFLCRFKLDELRLACGDVADAEMRTLQQSPCQRVNSLNEINQNLADIGDVLGDNNSSDEEIVSDNELEELHEFLLTQRQRNSGAQMPQSGPTEEILTGNEEDRNDSHSESEEDDVMNLSQALLRKLDETFAAERVEDENQILASSQEETEGKICDKLNDLPSSVHSCDSDQLTLAALDSSVVEADDVNSSLGSKLSSSADCREDNPALSSKLAENIITDRVEDDDKTENQQTSFSEQQDSEMCDTLKDSHTNCPTLVSAADEDVVVKYINGSDSKIPTSADACEGEIFSNNVTNNDPLQHQASSPVQPPGVQSGNYSAASPPSLFEESSLEQWEFERMNTSKDTSAPAGDGCHTLGADFIGVDALDWINVPESPNDLFDSPSSRNSEISPAVSSQVQSEMLCQQSNQTPPSSPKSTSSAKGSSQMQLEIPAPIFSHESVPSLVENLQLQPERLTEQGNQSPSAEAEVEVIEVIEAKPSSHQLDNSIENGIVSKRGSLRKVRAKTRNSVSSKSPNVSHYSSTPHASDFSQISFRHRRNPKSRPIYSDVEPDSDDDDEIVSQVVSPRKSRLSRRVSLNSRSASTQLITKECCVKLKRIDDADLLPQVEIFTFLLMLNSLFVTELKLCDI